jgi:hypothetical protein
MTEFFTRLTPNFKDWQKPSGRDGKCSGANPLYEETNGFGWEEWLFEDYFANIDNPDFECIGFVEAFNQQNKDKNFVYRLYLYTKLCNNNNGHNPGCYFVGYIDNVKRIDPLSKGLQEVDSDLFKVGINQNSFLPMLSFAKNISFCVKDVKINFSNVYNQPIQLNRGQFRFSLYDLNEHPNFLTTINKHL